MNARDDDSAGRLADTGWWLALVRMTPLLGLAGEAIAFVVADSPFSSAGAAAVAMIAAFSAVGGELISAVIRRVRDTRA